MTEFELLEIIGEAEDRYIMESRKRPQRKNARWPYALAAVLALAVIGGAGAGILHLSRRDGGMESMATMQESAAAEAPMEPAIPEAEKAEEAPVPMPAKEYTADTEADAAENAAPATDQTVDLGSYGSVVPLAAAEYPESIGNEDFQAQSDNWKENQTSDDTKSALNAFAYSTASRLLAGQTGSGCYSPLSLYQTLSILASGAAGQTRDQLLNLLGQGDAQILARESGRLYRVNYSDNPVNILKISNSLWLDGTAADGTPVEYNRDWVMSAARDYYADVYEAEFSDPDTVLALGDWIAQRTGGLLHPDPGTLSLPENTVMAIVNTLWYESPWQASFEQENTRSGDFTAPGGEKITCDYMHGTRAGQVIQTSEYTKSYLPLDRGRMIFVLPQEGVDVESLLTEEKLWEIFENGDYSAAEVNWSVPKLSINATYGLDDMLRELGVTDAYGEAADFSPISDTPLILGKVQQGTHLALDEDGVEAAAYTVAAIEAAGEMMDPPKVDMDLNRPFLYLITANDGSTLFMGVVRDPG